MAGRVLVDVHGRMFFVDTHVRGLAGMHGMHVRGGLRERVHVQQQPRSHHGVRQLRQSGRSRRPGRT